MAARRVPEVVDGMLRIPGAPDGAETAVGSLSWVAWLEDRATRSFSFRGPGGNYTARKERRARGGEYWVAYRKRSGKLRKIYLGKTRDLTPDKLDAAVAVLAGDEAATVGASATNDRSPQGSRQSACRLCSTRFFGRNRLDKPVEQGERSPHRNCNGLSETERPI